LIQDNNDGDTIKFFEGVAECLMNDSDTLKDVKIRAKNLAEQNAQQKIVDYIRDFLEYRYLTFPDDEILSIANEIFKISNINYGMKESGGNEMIIQSAVIAQIDDNDIMNCLVGFFNERTELKSENDSLREEIDDLKCQIEDLRLQIDELTPQVTSKDKVILANQKYNEAWKLSHEKNYDGAIKLFNETIKLNPNNYNVYFGRGSAYSDLGQFERAIQDYNEAIELNPIADWLYNSRGECYQKFVQYELAIKDFDKAIELNPNWSQLYKNRGDCYQKLGDEAKAQSDFAKAKQLGYNF